MALLRKDGDKNETRSGTVEAALSIIAAGMRITGDLETNGTLKVDGRIEGSVLGARQMMLGRNGTVQGNVHAGEVVVGGLVDGAIIAACASARDSTDDAEGKERFMVALLTPGPISDQSWNGGAYEGLMRIRDSLGAQVSHIQTKTPAEFEENFRQYGADEYSLVFGHGFEFQDAAARVGPAFPKTVFVTTGGTRTSANVSAMSFAFEQPSYLAGLIAASVSKSGIIGCIGGA